MGSLHEDLPSYLDCSEEGTVDFSEYMEGLENLGVTQSLEGKQAGLMKLRLMSEL